MEKVVTLTLNEALERAEKTPPVTARTSRAAGTGWAGAPFEEAMRLARDGDPSSAVDLKRRLGTMAAIRPKERAVQRWGVAGSVVDMGRYMASEPDCMIETVRARRSQPVMKIAIERAVNSHVPIETIRATGMSVLAVVESLRTAGVPSEIWVTFTIAASSGSKLSTQVLVQEAGRPIDVDRLAFWVTRPEALRRVAFALMEQEDEKTRHEFDIGHAYGYAVPAIGDFDEIAPATEDKVTSWIADVLARRAGVQLREVDER